MTHIMENQHEKVNFNTLTGVQLHYSSCSVREENHNSLTIDNSKMFIEILFKLLDFVEYI